MIKLIVTNSGYVESSHMSNICWTFGAPASESIELIESITKPETALISLATELAEVYRRDFLFDYSNHVGHSYRIDFVEETCEECSNEVYKPFDPEDFLSFLYDLNSAVASAAIGQLSIDELDHWWPWDTFEEIWTAGYKPEEILLVEKKFESLGAASVITDKFHKDKEALVEFRNRFPYKVIQTENGFWKAQEIYVYLGEDESERVNKV